MELFFIMSMEIYSGAILPNEIRHLIGRSTVSREFEKNNNKENEPNKYKEIEAKYGVNFFETIISIEEWETFFGRGFIDPEKINSSLKMTRYFSRENTADWIKLWNFYDLEDAEFDELYQSVRANFDNYEILEPGEIKHISGLWLNFSRRRLIVQTVEESLAENIAYIDEVFSSGNVNVKDTSLEQINGYSSYANLCYSDVESDEFKEMSDHLNEKVREVQMIKLSERTKEVIDIIKSDPIQLYTLLCYSNYQKSPFYSRPIMQYIPPQKFIDLMSEISNSSKRIVADVLFSRYEHQGLNTPLLPELPWLDEVVSKLSDIIDDSDNVKPSSIMFDYMKSKLDKSLIVLRASKPIEPAPG